MYINLLKFLKARSAKPTNSIDLNATGCVFGTTRRVWCVFCRLLAVREGDCRPNWCRHPNRSGLKQLRCGKRPFKTESHCIQFKPSIYQDTHRESFERREALFRRWNNHREMAATGGVGGMRDCRAWRERAPSPTACEEQNVCRLAAVVRKHLCCAILY